MKANWITQTSLYTEKAQGIAEKLTFASYYGDTIRKGYTTPEEYLNFLIPG